MRPTYRIVPARAPDLPFLPVIELAAATLLAGHAPESVLMETTPLSRFRQAMTGGRLWVALTAETPVGFAYVALLPSGAPHLQEMGVHPSHGRQGLGSRLLTSVCEWSALNGHASLTLTTFRDVTFNMPFYAHHGFQELAPGALSEELRAIVADEAERGLDAERRVVMRLTARASRE